MASSTTANQTLSVLIVGAGPVGLTFASEMARYGVDCRIVDRAKGTKEISKALILHVRTQEVLDAMGVGSAPQQIGVPMRRIEMTAYGKHIGHGVMEGINSPFPYPIILGQNVTEHILQEHLASLGTHVEWESEAMDLIPTDDGNTVTIRHSDGSTETIHARFVIGADGTHSTVRQHAGLTFEGNPYEGQAFIQSDSKIRWSLPRGVGYLWFTEEGYMMVIDMPGDIVRTFISVPDKDPTKKTTTLEEVNETLNRLAGVDAELYDPIWVALFRTNHRAAASFRKGSVFLAGDAAHEHVPIGGQGMNTSIQDAFNLAWKLAYVLKGYAPPQLLDTYQAERHPVAESLLHGTDQAYKKILAAGEFTKSAVRLFGPYLLKSDTVREKLRNTIEEVDINYRSGPITLDLGGSKGPKAGDRFLDVDVVSLPEKETVRLRAKIAGKRWTLLVFTGPSAGKDIQEQINKVAGEVQQINPDVLQAFVIRGGNTTLSQTDYAAPILADATNRVHEEYGVEDPCLYLVRPDRYIGFRGPLSEAENLRSYLHSHLIPANHQQG